jgi:hypothetical protein
MSAALFRSASESMGFLRILGGIVIVPGRG